MIRLFASSTATSMVPKIGTKKQLLYIKSPLVDRFWCLRCLNDRINLSNMTALFASGTTASPVAKNGTKNLCQPFEDGF